MPSDPAVDTWHVPGHCGLGLGGRWEAFWLICIKILDGEGVFHWKGRGKHDFPIQKRLKMPPCFIDFLIGRSIPFRDFRVEIGSPYHPMGPPDVNLSMLSVWDPPVVGWTTTCPP